MATDSINQTLFYSFPGADEIYRSKWFAFTAFAFLKDKNKCKKTLDSSQSRNVSQQEDSDVSLFSLSLVLVSRSGHCTRLARGRTGFNSRRLQNLYPRLVFNGMYSAS